MISKTYQQAVDSNRLKLEIEQSSITVALDRIETSSAPSVTVYFKADFSSEEALLDAVLAAHEPTPLPDDEIKTVSVANFTPSSVSSLPKMATYPAEGDGATIVSHNFADKCSWFFGSEAVIGEQLTESNGVYSSLNPYWIDLTHGRLYDEDAILGENPEYAPKIYVDAVEVTTGFTINYPAGTVTFDSPPVGVVTADYHFADTSYFRLKPREGKILTIQQAEVQFSKNAQVLSPFVFEVWGPFGPSATMVPVPGTRIAYKNAKDFISACNEGQGLIPAWGELTQDVHVFPFKYTRIKALKYSQGLEIRVYIQDHQAIPGELATGTFYVGVDSE